MRLKALLLLAGLPAFAQAVIDIARLDPSLRSMEAGPEERPLNCSVTPIPPAMNFSLRIQAAYSVRVPMSQYLGKGHRWAQIIRVTPLGGDRKPVFLGYRIDLPNVPPNKSDVEFGGGYLVGEGSYDCRVLTSVRVRWSWSVASSIRNSSKSGPRIWFCSSDREAAISHNRHGSN